MIKSYSIFTVPAGVQPAEFGEECLRKVLVLAQCKETVEDCSFKILSGHLYITDVSQTAYICVYAPGQWSTVKVEWRDRWRSILICIVIEI